MNNINDLGVKDYTTNVIKYDEDKVFKGIVEAISPEKIFKENKEIIDAFVDILVSESPISVNIIDIFNKDKSVESLNNIQKEFAKVYLNNFYEVWNKAKENHRLKNQIENLLKKYQSVGIRIGRNESFLKFFENEDEMYTADRYMMAKTFNEKKGTEVALEYAYKLAWLSGIEGPLRDAYFFNIHSESCFGLSEGFIICGSSLTDPVPPEPTQEEKDLFPNIWPLPNRNPILCSSSSATRIGAFTISDTVSNSSCTKFTYQVEGSILPELFEAFVLPLAHPVGFNYIYKKITSILFEDYFNLEYIYRCDEIGVRSLCKDGDCSKPITEAYAVRAKYENGIQINSGGGISHSQLKYIEEGIIVEGTYKNWNYEKYIFDNGNYLIQYTYSPPIGKPQKVIEYFDIIKNRRTNFVKNSQFDTWYDWFIQDNGNWIIRDGYAEFLGKSTSGEEDQYKLTQPISLDKDKNYEIVIKIEGLDTNQHVIFRVNERNIYDDQGNIIDIEYDQWVLSENIEYNLGYTAYGGEKIQIFTEEPNVTFKIDYVNIFINEPEKRYVNEVDQSDIYIVNLDVPKVNLFTYDELVSLDLDSYFPEDMNTLYTEHIKDEDKFPIIGINTYINEYHFGQATYSTTGEIQLVNILEHTTVDYLIPTRGNGKLRTRYEAVRDLGLVDLLSEDFTDTTRWRVLANNINLKLEPDSGISNESAFVIGGYDTNPPGLVIPEGAPDTTYMKEALEMQRDFEEEWIDGLEDISFTNPSKWFMTSDWRIETFTSPEQNYAEIKPRNTIQTTGNTQIVDVQVGTLIEYIEEVQGPDNDKTPPFGYKYVVYESLENRGSIDINKEDFETSPKWRRYRRTTEAILYRDIDTDTILTNEIIKINTFIEFQSDYNDVGNWVDVVVGSLGDFIYSYRENQDYWVDITTNDLVTYQIYKNGILESEAQYEALSNLGTLNLKDEDFTDNTRWEQQPNTDNVPKYTYKSFDNNVVINLTTGMSIDIITENYFSDKKRVRYISKTTRNNVNLNWENFEDTSLWTKEDVNDPIRITNNTNLEYGVIFKPGDKISFIAGYTFRGKINYFDVKVFNERL